LHLAAKRNFQRRSSAMQGKRRFDRTFNFLQGVAMI